MCDDGFFFYSILVKSYHVYSQICAAVTAVIVGSSG